MRWDDGSTATFQNIGRCNFYTANPPNYIDQATCFAGFVTLSNPMGRQVCTVASVYYYKNAQLNISGKTGYTTANCRYK